MKLQTLIDQAAEQPKKTVAVAVAEDHEVIVAVAKAVQLQLAQFRLYGNQETTMNMLQEHGLQPSEHIEVISAISNAEAAELAVKACRALDIDIAGVDIIQEDQSKKNYVLEVNSAPRWEAIRKDTGINPEKEIVKYLVTC